jgi:hypothetical protein
MANDAATQGIGLIGRGMGAVSGANAFLQSLEAPKQREEWQPPGAMKVGSSEAFSQIIKSMVGKDKPKMEEKQLNELQKISKDVATFVNKLLGEGITTLARIDNLADGT